jgi:hypothetical protein
VVVEPPLAFAVLRFTVVVRLLAFVVRRRDVVEPPLEFEVCPLVVVEPPFAFEVRRRDVVVTPLDFVAGLVVRRLVLLPSVLLT